MEYEVVYYCPDNREISMRDLPQKQFTELVGVTDYINQNGFKVVLIEDLTGTGWTCLRYHLTRGKSAND